MSDYTPTAGQVRLNHQRARTMEVGIAEAGAEFDRFVAKIKADALREAARDMRAQVERATEHQRFTEHELVESGVEHVLNEYADRIEEEA